MEKRGTVKTPYWTSSHEMMGGHREGILVRRRAVHAQEAVFTRCLLCERCCLPRLTGRGDVGTGVG